MLKELMTLLNNEDTRTAIDFIKNIIVDENKKTALKKIIPLISTGFGNIYQYAICKCSTELENLLCSNDLISLSYYTRKLHGQSLLELAVKYGNYNFVEKQMKKGVNPNDDALLFIAVLNFDLRMMELLLRFGANPNPSVSFQHSAIRSLLDVSLPLNLIQIKDKLKFETTRFKALQLLIKYGANVLQIGKKDIPFVELVQCGMESASINKKEYLPELIALIKKETAERLQFKYNMGLLFWASRNDENSIVSAVNNDCLQYIANQQL